MFLRFMSNIYIINFANYVQYVATSDIKENERSPNLQLHYRHTVIYHQGNLKLTLNLTLKAGSQ